MSDYLSNLAARTLNVTAVIQPRLAGRFEPVQAQGPLDLAQPAIPPALEAEIEFNVERMVEPVLASPVLPLSVTQLPVVSAPQPSSVEPSTNLVRETRHPMRDALDTETIRPAPPRPGNPDRQHEAGHNQAHLVRPFASTIDDRTTAAKTHNGMDEPGRPVQAEQPRSQIRRLAEFETLRESAVPRDANQHFEGKPQDDQSQPQFSHRQTVEVLPARVVPGREIQRIVETSNAAHTGEIDEREARINRDTIKPVQRKSEVGQPDRSTSPATVVAQPRVEIVPPIRSASPVADQPHTSQESTAAPTIQVTIGRIEVRATTPLATAPARKAHTTPVMSLDDYLRAGNGGNR